MNHFPPGPITGSPSNAPFHPRTDKGADSPRAALEQGSGRALAWWKWPAVHFLVAATVVVLVSRSAVIEDDREISVDESLYLCQALRYAQNMVPWESVDTATSGPLNVWPFALFKMMGVSLGYSGMHLLAALAVVGMVWLTWATLRAFASFGLACCGAGVLVLVICRATQNDYVHFSSELIPMLLISAALCLVSAGIFGKASHHWAWPIAAFLLGAAPWAKLQAAPICVAVFTGMVALIWYDPKPGADVMKRGFRSRIRFTAVTTLAFGAVSWLMVVFLWLHGSLADAWDSYVIRNAIYASDNGAGISLAQRASDLFTRHTPFREFFLGLAVFGLAWMVCGCRGLREASRDRLGFLGVALLSLTASCVATLVPAFGLGHYDWFLFQPMVLVAASILILWADPVAGRPAGRKVPVALAAWVAAAYALQMAPWVLTRAPAIPLPYNHAIFGNEFQSRISALIRTLPKPKGPMFVWGWSPNLHVLTQLKPASRYADSACLVESYPLRDQFRTRLLEDLRKEPPAVIVDAMAPGCFTWRWDGSHRLETFPALAGIVAQEYHLAASIPYLEGIPPVQIYLRN